jgi:tetratricopeptide (TPR) repeat protein
MMTGEVAPIGSSFVVTLGAVDCQSGDSLALLQAEAGSKEEVLAALGEAATKMRRQLGESLATIERFDAPIEQATTASLEAFKSFVLGAEERARSGDKNAVPYFERAIELDPNFAMAHARLGTVHGNLFEPDKALEYRRRAFELRDRVSELERLYIGAHYYGAALGDLDKQIETYELWKRTYPRDWTPYNNLAVGYTHQIGDFDKALPEAQEALRLQPDHLFSYQNLAWAYLTVGRSDEAAAVCHQALDKGYDSLTTRYVLWMIAKSEGDEVAAQKQVDSQTGTWGEAWMYKSEAEEAIDAGQIEEARALGRRAVEAAQRFEMAEMASLTAEAPETGDLMAELEERFPQDTLIQNVYLPGARAAQAMHAGDPATAVELLKSATPYERAHLWVIYLRGLAYLELDRADEATVEFRKIDEVQGVWAPVSIRSLAQLGLARALAASGDTAGARRAYDDLLVSWKNADQGFGLHQEAQAEYAALD